MSVVNSRCRSRLFGRQREAPSAQAQNGGPQVTCRLMGWVEAAQGLDDRVLGASGSRRGRRRLRVLLVVALVWIPSVTAAKAWSVAVGLAVAVLLGAPVVALVRLVSVRGPEWVERAQRSEQPLMVRVRSWDGRVFGSRPSENRLLDFLNSLGNGPLVAPAFLGLSVMGLTCALLYKLVGRDELAGQALSSIGWSLAAAIVSRVAWNRRCQERRGPAVGPA